MIVYHYTRLTDWRGIAEGSSKSNDLPGLAPNMFLANWDPECRKVRASFAFLNPLPPEWISNHEFPYIWATLKSNIGKLLLELTVDEDRTFVVDWGHREGVLSPDKSTVPSRYCHDSEFAAEAAYVKSMIPLKDYLSGNVDSPYSLPEVVIPETIPLSRIAISQQQPLLEEMLGKVPEGSFRRYRLREIMDIPQLKGWYSGYLERAGGRIESPKGFAK